MLLVKEENSQTTPSYENKTLFLSFWNRPVIFHEMHEILNDFVYKKAEGLALTTIR